jgi:hypothetical protein
MSDDIYGILQRLDLIEGRITPATVKKGLNTQQKSVPQMPALFKMPRQGPVLGGDPNKKASPAGYMFGDDVEVGQKPLAETMAEIDEDMISKVKKDLTHYLDQLADKVKVDQDLKDKAVRDIEDNDPTDPGTQEEDVEVDEMRPGQGQISTIPEPASSPVKTIPLEDGSVLEIHGDQRRGFTIHNGPRRMPSSFKELDEAEMAVNLYRARRPIVKSNSGADYVEEA